MSKVLKISFETYLFSNKAILQLHLVTETHIYSERYEFSIMQSFLTAFLPWRRNMYRNSKGV